MVVVQLNNVGEAMSTVLITGANRGLGLQFVATTLEKVGKLSQLVVHQKMLSSSMN